MSIQDCAGPVKRWKVQIKHTSEDRCRNLDTMQPFGGNQTMLGSEMVARVVLERSGAPFQEVANAVRRVVARPPRQPPRVQQRRAHSPEGATERVKWKESAHIPRQRKCVRFKLLFLGHPSLNHLSFPLCPHLETSVPTVRGEVTPHPPAWPRDSPIAPCY